MNKPFKDMSLSELAHERAVLADYILRGVVRARQEKTSWAAIGAQLGCATSEAHRRYQWIEKLAKADTDSKTEGPGL